MDDRYLLENWWNHREYGLTFLRPLLLVTFAVRKPCILLISCVFTQVPRGRLRDLVLKTPRTSFILWFLWFGAAYLYYGIVLAQSEILEFHKTCGAGESAAGSCQWCEEVASRLCKATGFCTD